jgi:putative glutamine amidotransferase
VSSNPIVVVSAAIRSGEGDVPVARLRTTYLAALENARLVPVASPPLHDTRGAAALLATASGLVLTGGADVSPALYGARPHPKLGDVSDERDRWETALVEAARERALPTLAICRGAQILNVALGGTLVQDLPSERPSEIDHDPTLPRTTRSHALDVQTDSRLARALGVTALTVNSVHHQAIDRPADSLRVVATAPDGVVEGVETAPDSPWWCVGVQWHPEDLIGGGEPWDRMLFEAFANAVRAR